MSEKVFLSKEKFEELKAELEDLKTNKRKEISEQLEYARSLGDLSENAEYHEVRDTQARIEDRINHLEQTLKYAEIVEHHSSGTISLGSVVTLKKTDGKEIRYTLVGPEESDITNGKLSIKSPIGEAMNGKKKGESFTVKTPAGETVYAVVATS